MIFVCISRLLSVGLLAELAPTQRHRNEAPDNLVQSCAPLWASTALVGPLRGSLGRPPRPTNANDDDHDDDNKQTNHYVGIAVGAVGAAAVAVGAPALSAANEVAFHRPSRVI